MAREITVPDRAQNAVMQWSSEIAGLNLLPMTLIGRLSEAAQVIMREHLEPEFARVGLKSGEFDVLATLRRSGKPFTLTPTELYNSTMVSSGGMTARLDRLQKMSLIERKPHPTDRRGLTICLTQKGQSLIENLLPQYVEAQEKALTGLSLDEQKQLTHLLGLLTKSLSE